MNDSFWSRPNGYARGETRSARRVTFQMNRSHHAHHLGTGEINVIGRARDSSSISATLTALVSGGKFTVDGYRAMRDSHLRMPSG
jgi:hypothetical protein